MAVAGAEAAAAAGGGAAAAAGPRAARQPLGRGEPACRAAEAVPSWCWGPRGGGLGTCDGLEDRAFCFSSADDRPEHFLTPLEFTEVSASGRGGGGGAGAGSLGQEAAFQALRKSTERLGGLVQEVAGPEEGSAAYLWAFFPDDGDSVAGVFGSGGGTDVEWVFLPDDDVVDIRALSRSGASILGNALERRRGAQLLRDLRRELGWEEVPVMRYRERTLGVLESPLDKFGPEAPPTLDYAKDLPPDSAFRQPKWNVD